MKDLPMFTTQNGVASLTLREIPYQQTAYIKLQATRQPKELLEECVGFCRAVGAEKIYASGHEILENYPFHTAIVQMQCLKESVADTDAALWPLQKEKLGEFLDIYREKIQHVPNGAWFTDADGEKLHFGAARAKSGRRRAGTIQEYPPARQTLVDHRGRETAEI